VGLRRWRELVIGKNGEVFFYRPKPTAGCSANGRKKKDPIIKERGKFCMLR
jgi:hypothetical protein